MLDTTLLHQQNHGLSEIAQVLPFLAQNRALCDTDTVRELFFRASHRVNQHLCEVDKLVKQLFTDPDARTRNVARKLVADSSLLRRNFDSYVRRWSNDTGKDVRIGNHVQFANETRALFDLLLERIERETEQLLPLLRKLEHDRPHAA